MAKLSPLMISALAISALIAVIGIIAPQALASFANTVVSAQFASRGWFIMLLTSSLLFVAIYLAFSEFGAIKLGPDDAEPEFSTPSWIAMLFAAGMGVGLLFYGTAEPLTHFEVLRSFERDPLAAEQALFVTYLNWGLHAWAIYGIVALVIAYFGYRHGQLLMLSAPLDIAFGRSVWTARFGWLFNLCAIVAIAVGLAGSLAMGVFQVRTGVAELFGVRQVGYLTAPVFVVLCLAFVVPLRRDLGDGMAKLSNAAMVVSIALLVYLVIAGPTSYAMNAIVSGFGRYAFFVLPAGFSTAGFLDDKLVDWFEGWTLTYMIWWLAWSPFVGVFIARISRGRTIRSFLTGVILAPTLFSIVWFGGFGALGFFDSFERDGTLGAIANSQIDHVTFALLDQFPLSALTSLAVVIAAFLFVVTSVVSAAFVLAMFATGGDEDPPANVRTLWGGILGALGLAMLLTGDVGVVRSIIALCALAFIFIVPVLVLCLLRALRRETLR
ncbi:MAG: BCCT family transporter [Geminicoccaceae bacterium]